MLWFPASFLVEKNKKTTSYCERQHGRAKRENSSVYIREQERNDIVVDKLSVKEYEDPFSRVVLTDLLEKIT